LDLWSVESEELIIVAVRGEASSERDVSGSVLCERERYGLLLLLWVYASSLRLGSESLVVGVVGVQADASLVPVRATVPLRTGWFNKW
jgi:hypothetical protein